jgi:hypothetical protein
MMMHRSIGSMGMTLALLLGGACTGLSLGERDPGGDVHLEGGAIAVDPRTETSFVLQILCDEPEGSTCPGVETRTLHVIAAEPGADTGGIDVTGLSDLRILFPASSVLVMGEPNTAEERLRLFDPVTMEERVQSTSSARYRGTRLSPSGRWLAVSDQLDPQNVLHVIDIEGLLEDAPATVDPHVVPHGGSWLEAMWLNQRDELVAVVFEGPDTRILSWTMDQQEADDFETENGYWANPHLDISVPDTSPDIIGSFTWVGVAPDDHLIVFPVVQGDTHVLLVVSPDDGELRVVPDARGPVGFTPDGGTIVSYRYVDDGAGGTLPELLLVDAETLDTTSLSIPWTSGPQYFVSRESNHLVVAAAIGNQKLVLYDLDAQEVTELDGPEIGLHEFVSRLGHDELWLVDDGLHRLDFVTEAFETVPLDWTPAHINILRQRDQLVLDDEDASRVLFWSPQTREVAREVLLAVDL